MYQRIALIENISRTTADQLREYLTDFARGTHRLLWLNDRAFVEVSTPIDAELIRREFPNLVKQNFHYTGANFPW